jgi:hypothetical protein
MLLSLSEIEKESQEDTPDDPHVRGDAGQELADGRDNIRLPAVRVGGRVVGFDSFPEGFREYRCTALIVGLPV